MFGSHRPPKENPEGSKLNNICICHSCMQMHQYSRTIAVITDDRMSYLYTIQLSKQVPRFKNVFKKSWTWEWLFLKDYVIPSDPRWKSWNVSLSFFLILSILFTMAYAMTCNGVSFPSFPYSYTTAVFSKPNYVFSRCCLIIIYVNSKLQRQ